MKTTVRYHCTTTWVIKLLTIVSACKNVKQFKLTYLCFGVCICDTTLGNWQCLLKLNIYILYDPANALFNIYLQKYIYLCTKRHIQGCSQHNCLQWFKSRKKPNVSFNSRMNDKFSSIYKIKYYIAKRMGESHKHLNQKSQIPKSLVPFELSSKTRKTNQW